MNKKEGKQLGEPGRKKELKRMEGERMEGYGVRLEEKQLVSALLRNDGKLIASYREAFPGEAERVSERTMLSRAREMVRRTRVQRYVKQVMESKEISPEWTIGSIAKLASGAERDSDKLKALEMLGKFQKLFKMESGDKVTFNFNIDEQAATRLLERRKRHEIGGRGDFIDIREEEGGREGGDGSDDIDGKEEFN